MAHRPALRVSGRDCGPLRALRAAGLSALLVLLLAGCESMREREGGLMRDGGVLSGVGWPVRGEPPAAEYLALAADLASDLRDDEREAMAEAVHEAFHAAPTAPNRLRLAIVQAAPDHALSDADAARENFELLLSLTDVLNPAERDLARLFKAQLDHERTIAAEMQHLRAHAHGLQGDVETLEQRLATLRSDIERLSAQIRRLTDVERAIDERGRDEPTESTRNSSTTTRRQPH